MPSIDRLLIVRRSANCDPRLPWRRSACVATLLIVGAMVTAGTADTIELAVHGGGGQVWLYNPNAAPFDLVYYSINSASGALNGSNGVWTSIADTYDASAPMPGQGSVDPNDSWIELSAAADMLAEGVFVGDGGTLAAAQSVSLGTVWNPAAGMGDLSGQVVEASASEPVAMPVVFTWYYSDFDFDADADLADLAIWRANLGTGTLHSQGDADLDGNVDGDDFLLWQREIATVIGPGSAAGASLPSAVSVPEPTTVWLLCAGIGALVMARSARTGGRRQR